MTDESDTGGVAARTAPTDPVADDVTGSGSLGNGPESAEGAPEPVNVGDVVGSYRLIELLGTGGMGRVFRAEHTKLGRAVALKVLNRRYSNNKEAVQRLFGEARAVNQIHHENLIEITDFLDPPEGVACYVMELLQGETVRACVSRGPLPPERVAAIGAQVASALAATHAIGVVHRDLKPENVFLTTRGERSDFVKLLDFGVAKLSPAVAGDPAQPVEDAAVLGTPPYMSPEQLAKGVADAPSDIYSLGVTLYEMLTAARPFSAVSRGDLVIKHLLEMPPPMARAGVPAPPPDLERLVLACLAKEPGARPTAGAMASSLHALAVGPAAAPAPSPVRGPRRPLVAALLAAALGVLAVVGGVTLLQTDVAVAPAQHVALPAEVTLRFESTPAAAAVTRAGGATPLGLTPFTLSLPRSEEQAAFVFTLPGRPPVESRVSLASSATIAVVIPEPAPVPEEPTPVEKQPGKRPGRSPGATREHDDTVILDPFAR
ncbi:MAG: serine/threonine protein kinase [Deltaproteobacteria bacterium]|nr:serine/threonine protein kinase [Deltaproteobacteria bacterium]